MVSNEPWVHVGPQYHFVEHILLNSRNICLFPDVVCVGTEQDDPVVAAVFVEEDIALRNLTQLLKWVSDFL